MIKTVYLIHYYSGLSTSLIDIKYSPIRAIQIAADYWKTIVGGTITEISPEGNLIYNIYDHTRDIGVSVEKYEITE